MSRLARLYLPGFAQLVLQRGHNRQAIFLDEQDLLTYRAHLREASREAQVSLHAYVLMPNHIHLLATASEEKGMGKMMQNIGRRYVRYFNDRHARTGTLWEGRYRSTVVEPHEYLIECCQYIEQNPVRAQLVQEPQHYLWSSCLHHLGRETDPLISDHTLFWNLGNTPFERQMAYQKRLEQGLDAQKLAQIRFAAPRGWLLGQVDQSLLAQSSRRPDPLPRGRPLGSKKTPP